ncbi:MAG TPA: GNAT family N-acetyltransferase [Tepidisphaeraceae bacterium]|nr:GNAT family N-acetyltransferase [Tepidisphaeraceae bacterium]
MSEGDSNSSGSDPGKRRLQGFAVRRPRAEEVPFVAAFFPGNPLGTQNIIYLGAFGQPGDVPLGAVVVRAFEGAHKKIGEFLIFVRADCRRRKIGTMLMRHLYSLAIANHADQMILADLVHQDRADNAFYRSCGLLPDRALSSYAVEIKRGLAFCEQIVEHFWAGDSQMAGVSIVSLSTLELADIADFFAAYFPNLPGKYLADLRAGVYDLSLCCAAVRQGEIIASGLARTQAGASSIMLDLILTKPDFRSSPVSAAILAHSARLGLQRGLTHCVFEADERHDRFAIGFARRCGASPQWKRFRYVINRTEMQAWLG